MSFSFKFWFALFELKLSERERKGSEGNIAHVKTKINVKMRRLMTKPTKWLCGQWRLRSAWASAQSDQSLHCALNGYPRTQAFFMRTAKTLIRLGGCPGWSESSLGAHVILLVLSCGGSNRKCFCCVNVYDLKNLLTMVCASSLFRLMDLSIKVKYWTRERTK